VEFSLRPAINEDQSVIRKLTRSGGINPTGLDWQRFVVAVDPGGEVIGCVQLKPHRDGSVELASLVVEEGWRGRGVARSLVEFLLEEHTGDLYLMCRSGLGPLYEKFGFHALEEDEMPTYFRRVSKLVGIIEPLRRKNQTLLVMGRKGE
jgi:N-acetylglutamate synthase-like GNAT family acetyltransferase